MTSSQPTILTIAGSDSGGGAGIQADLKTFQAYGTYGTSVITAVTAQNTKGVQGVHEIPGDVVSLQLQSLLDDLPPAAIKIGMLSSSSIIQSLLTTLSAHSSLGSSLPPIVLDPVMISTSKDPLLKDDAVKVLVEEMLPLARVVTPNIPEAEVILGAMGGSSSGLGPSSSFKITDLQSMLRAAKTISANTLSHHQDGREISILLKGGHLLQDRSNIAASITSLQDTSEAAKFDVVISPGVDIPGLSSHTAQDGTDILRTYRQHLSSLGSPPTKVIVDLLITSTSPNHSHGSNEISTRGIHHDITLFIADAIDSNSTHGTGCTLSAAIAAGLGLGMDVKGAVQRAIAYTQNAISTAEPRGKGHGPLNHQVSLLPRLLPPISSTSPHPFLTHLLCSSPSLKSAWLGYTRHPFVVEIGKGSLDVERFKWYLVQDWHYLRNYARAHAMLAAKSTDFEEIKGFSTVALHIAKESEKHVEFCSRHGLSLAQIHATPESSANSAYSLYILDIGLQGDITELMVAVLSCLVGYGEVGVWLKGMVDGGEDGFVLEGNRYREWIETYSGDEFLQAVSTGITALEQRIASSPPSPLRLARLTDIWRQCVRYETGFWQMGMDMN